MYKLFKELRRVSYVYLDINGALYGEFVLNNTRANPSGQASASAVTLCVSGWRHVGLYASLYLPASSMCPPPPPHRDSASDEDYGELRTAVGLLRNLLIFFWQNAS